MCSHGRRCGYAYTKKVEEFKKTASANSPVGARGDKKDLFDRNSMDIDEGGGDQ